MIGAVVVKTKVEMVGSEIQIGLKNIRFFPVLGSEAFNKLSEADQLAARAYFEKEQDRVDRIMQEYEQGEW